MTTALIADAHLGTGKGDIGKFLSHLELLEKEKISRLILMGDIFHYYIGMKKWDSLYPAEIFDRFTELQKQGIEIVYLEGNRDFFLNNDSLLFHSVSSVCQQYQFDMPDGTVHTEHGDLLNREDRKYLIWRAFSRSIVIHAILKLFPRKILQPFVEGTEKRLKRTNFEYRRDLPTRQIEQFLTNLEKVKTVIVGHFHEEHLIEIEGKTLLILPAWLECRKALLLESASTWRWHALP